LDLYNHHVKKYFKILINRKRSHLYYLENYEKQLKLNKKYYRNNKKKLNCNRKKYKRLPWALRADNPKNKVKKVE